MAETPTNRERVRERGRHMMRPGLPYGALAMALCRITGVAAVGGLAFFAMRASGLVPTGSGHLQSTVAGQIRVTAITALVMVVVFNGVPHLARHDVLTPGVFWLVCGCSAPVLLVAFPLAWSRFGPDLRPDLTGYWLMLTSSWAGCAAGILVTWLLHGGGYRHWLRKQAFSRSSGELVEGTAAVGVLWAVILALFLSVRAMVSTPSETEVPLRRPAIAAPGGPTRTLVHAVTNGETLEMIAEMYGTRVEHIRWHNPGVRRNADLRDGLTLRVPYEVGGEVADPVPNGVPPPPPVPFSLPRTLEHTVSRDETLEMIAALYEANIADIRAHNPRLRGNAPLEPGTTLIIPYR